MGSRLACALFRDPAYDLLLDLVASEEEGRTVYATDCAVAARVPVSTILRYVSLLEAEGLIDREPDTLDGRRIIVRLTERARSAMHDHLGEIAALSPLR